MCSSDNESDSKKSGRPPSFSTKLIKEDLSIFYSCFIPPGHP